ncbi:MAG: hypothetical protein LKE29_06575 [Acidaminococcaceae bacterium]|jgi:hypothetical protein|nr:hypothetical protein [Acidaminococcaceae bacterium]
MFAFIKNFWHNHTKKIIAAVVFLIVFNISFWWLAYLASIHAAEIFNVAVANQNLVDGTITADRISANIKGAVTFENLQWIDRSGNQVVVIPNGSFKVRIWDIVMKHPSIGTITYAELDNAVLNLKFNKRMHIVGLKVAERVPEKKPANSPKRDKTKEPFNVRLKDTNMILKLVNCKITATSTKHPREFILNNVNTTIHYDSKDKITVDLGTGKFGGTLIGDGVALHGFIDLKPRIATYNLNLGIKELDPSSLGTGLNIKNKVTAGARIVGNLPDPLITGRLAMKELNIPALHFTKLVGDFRYQDGLITATNVHADVYGGNCDAYGSFALDSKAYDVYVKGHELRSEIAAKSALINCAIELDLTMKCTGDNKSTLTYGNFYSGPGNYAILKFDKISASFSNQYKNLQFSDVLIESTAGDITTPLFSIDDGKLHLGKIYLTNRETGTKSQVFQ